MSVPASTIDRFKVETTFGDGYVVHTTYEWEFSTRGPKRSSTWEEVRRIGSGAFGSVWLEKEQEGGLLRAVKRLQRASLQRVEFSREIQALIAVGDHKHLFVEFYGWYENRSEIFLSMEFIAHGDLSNYMQDNRTAKAEAGEVTHQILEGLKILHGEAICHRDLKPQNILVASLDPIWVKIADFGTSKRTNNTYLATFCGTPRYMAPEQLGLLPRKLRTREELSYALDMWALGCIVHELLTSEIPFLDTYEDDDMTGIDSEATLINKGIDMELLSDYCRGREKFPSDALHASLSATDPAVAFVQSLLVPSPKERVSAASALLDPWFSSTGYTSTWYTELEREFSSLGVVLDLGPDKVLLRQLRNRDIVIVFPPATNFIPLLERALTRGFNTAVAALLASRGCQLTDTSQIQLGMNGLVSNGHFETLQLLLSVKNDLDWARSGLLAVAAVAGRVDMVQLLLDNGGDVNERSSGGRTAWEAILECGNLELVKMFLRKGAAVGDGLNSPWTALNVAASAGHIEVVRLLLDNSDYVNAARSWNYGPTALQAAVDGGHLEVVKLLVNNMAYIHDRPGDIRIAWQAALAGGRVEIVELFLGMKTNVNDPLDCHRRPLEVAAAGGHTKLVELLLDNKADINADPVSYSCRTALQAAAGGGFVDVVKLLLEKGATVNAQHVYESAWTALQMAAGGGHIDVVKLLLEKEANIDAEPGNQNGRTALQAAAGGGHIDVVKLLLEKGVNVNAEPGNRNGRTGLQAAAGGGHIEVVNLLLDNKADLNANPSLYSGRTALQAAAGGGHIEVVKLLLVNGVHINAKPSDHDGRTALQAAAGGGHLEVVNLLLNKNADASANPSPHSGQTAVHAAQNGGHIEVGKVLMADILANGHTEVLKFLMAEMSRQATARKKV